MSKQPPHTQASWLRSGGFTLAQRLSAVVFGFAGFYFLIRVLTKEEFGVWSLFLTIITWIEMARNGLVQNAQIKFAAASTAADYPSILTGSFVLNALITGASCLVLLVLGLGAGQWFDSQVISGMLWQYTLTTIVLLPFSQFTFIQQSKLDFKGLFFSHFTRQGSFFVAIAYFYASGTVPSLPLLVALQTGAAALGALVAYVLSLPYLQLARQVQWGLVWQQFRFGKFVFGTNLASMVLSSIDQVLLGSILGPSSVALYASAFRISSLVDVPVSSLAQVAFPHSVMIAAQEGKQGLKRVYERSVGLLLALLVPFTLVVVLVPGLIIGVIAGEDYLDAVPLLQTIVLFAVFQPFIRQFGTMLDAVGKPQVNFYTILVLAMLNTGLNYVLIHTHGVQGAAWATLCTYMVALPIILQVLKRYIPISLGGCLAEFLGSYLQLFVMLKKGRAKTV